ncbi:MAG: hypothetical protein V4467_03340 [Patescibacteria group bacterium]
MKIKYRINETVSTNGLVLIAPTCISSKSLSVLQEIAWEDGKKLLSFYESTLAESLDQLLCTFCDLNGVKKEEALLVFPGASAVDVCRGSVFKDSYTYKHVYAKRFWFPDQDPVVTVGEIYTRRFINSGIRAILVLDDVISSGQTLVKLRERNAWKFPNAVWHAGSWITRKNSLKGYETLYSSLLVAHSSDKGLKVPINSLSTLCECGGEDVRRAYATKHFKRLSEDFLKFFEKVVVKEWITRPGISDSCY